MTIDGIVWNPEAIETIDEVENALSEIVKYEKREKVDAGILLLQGGPFGGSSYVVSREEAIRWLTKGARVQWGIKFYKRSYYEALREYLKSEKQPDYEKLDEKHAISRQHIK